MEHILILVFHFVLSKAAVRCEISSFPFSLLLPVLLILLPVNCRLAGLAAGAGGGMADPQALHPQGVSACSLLTSSGQRGQLKLDAIPFFFFFFLHTNTSMHAQTCRHIDTHARTKLSTRVQSV